MQRECIEVSEIFGILSKTVWLGDTSGNRLTLADVLQGASEKLPGVGPLLWRQPLGKSTDQQGPQWVLQQVRRGVVHSYHHIPRQCGGRGVLKQCAYRYFDPAVEVQPDHIICGEFPYYHYLHVRAFAPADLAC